ncbi:major capsid protein [Methylobacter marinus]|uniref:major capsid protein n=1 Tax=Methylobacter marinus TaxID=34058 RepID=UPI000364B85F|nr:major capsid protein [Methylobacter marinus]
MPSLDIFNDDAFGVVNLTAAINDAAEGQAVPGIIDDLFQEEGITSTAVFIERDGDTLTLVPTGERGAPGSASGKSKRQAIPFSTVHLPVVDGINADEVQNVRVFGSETELQTVEGMVNKRLMKMRKRLDATLAFHRIGALKGQVLDSDGATVLLDAFTSFGVTQQSVGMALTTETTKVRDKIVTAKRKAEDVIGDSGVITGWRAVCGRNFFDAFVGHPAIEAAYAGWSEAANVLLGDHRAAGFRVADVEWREYYGKVGGVAFIDPDEAYLIPIVDGLFITRYAPADYMETVNTIGLPYYAKQEPRRFNKGIDMEAQSNPFNICTKPRAIIKLTKV